MIIGYYEDNGYFGKYAQCKNTEEIYPNCKEIEFGHIITDIETTAIIYVGY